MLCIELRLILRIELRLILRIELRLRLKQPLLKSFEYTPQVSNHSIPNEIDH